MTLLLISNLYKHKSNLCVQKSYFVSKLSHGQNKYESGSNHIISFNNEYKLWLGVRDTPLGFRKFTKCPNGINNAPSNFQRELVQLLGDLVGLIIYIDDLLIGTKGNSCLFEMKLIQYSNSKQSQYQKIINCLH